MSDDQFEKFKQVFKDDFSSIQSIERLKELFATELARRDELIASLQEQNKLLLRSAFKEKESRLDMSKS